MRNCMCRAMQTRSYIVSDEPVHNRLAYLGIPSFKLSSFQASSFNPCSYRLSVLSQHMPQNCYAGLEMLASLTPAPHGHRSPVTHHCLVILGSVPPESALSRLEILTCLPG